MPRGEASGSTFAGAGEAGAGGSHAVARTALLLPALSSISAAAEMAPLAARLEPWLHCTTADWPGFGDRPRGRPSLTPDALRDFLDELIGTSVVPPAVGIAAGHAATYLVHAARRRPERFERLVLIAPTWRGPLPTVLGEARRPLFARIRRAIELPVLGPTLYRLNVNRRMIGRMMRAHVYADPARVTDALVAEKLHVAGQPDARFGTAAFVTGGLDPAASREAFLDLFTGSLPPVLMLRPAQAPRRSAAEMDALAATGRVTTTMVPGALAPHEEHPDEVAAAIGSFLGRSA
ncbi:alpha/beta fold hydrolase [Geminicoccus harenae]|uniref:alpha/beta fold hydrolase n=1 Tax=Geminicoccus harenae TaxID=2498453 RepID=UPI001C94AFE5|nr:alpha/beta hydrolase [Geminicoccus harenae]